MESIENLREYGHDCCARIDDAIKELADAIEVEHDIELNRQYNKGYNAGYDCGFASADDWIADHEAAMEEHGWVKLPVDADGEVIHIGDRVEDNERVVRIVLTDGSWEPSVYIEMLPNVLHEHFCNEISHYHEPTVEDVLTEFAAKLIERGELTNGAAQTIAEYAAKLRLADDGKEQ